MDFSHDKNNSIPRTASGVSPQIPFIILSWRRVKKWLRRPENVLGIILLIIIVAIILIPILNVIQSSFKVHFTDTLSRVPGAKVGDWTLYHWRDALQRPSVLQKPLVNTIVISIGATFLVVFLGSFFAWLIKRTDVLYKPVISGFAMIPFILPSWAYSLAWLQIFQNQGIGRPPGFIEYFFGIQAPSWLVFGPLPIIIVLGIHYYPFTYLLVASALNRIDSQLEESAFLLGASRFKVFYQIIIPIVLPAILSAIVLTLSRTLGNFSVPTILGSPVRYNVLSTQIFSGLQYMNHGQTFVLSLVLILMAVFVLWVNKSIIGTRKSFVTISGKGGKETLTRLGRYRAPIGIGTIVFFLFVVVVPMGLLVYSTFLLNKGDWSFGNFTLQYWIGKSDPRYYMGTPGLFRNTAIWNGTRNTLKIAALTGVFASIIGILIGYVCVKKRGSLMAGLIDRISFSSMLVPEIAFGAVYLALVAVNRPFLPPLYGTLAVLVIAAVAKRIPYTAQIGTSSMYQIGSELEEAATIQGASWGRSFIGIMFPLAREGFVAGFLVTIITVIRSISLFILLITPATAVLTTLSFRYTEDGAYQIGNALMVFIVAIILILTGAVQLVNKYTRK